jgi:dienelactone hydrolase
MVAVFPDSYTPRGTCENEGDYKNPPLKFEISGTFIRNSDAIAVLELLRSLVWADTKTPVIDSKNVAILGFSDGGTAAISTLYDTKATPPNWVWKQSFSGQTYTSEILPPQERPASGGFKAGVLYYAGAFHNSYYGDLCDAGEGIYKSYCDILIHLPDEDPLTENAECLITTMLHNGGGLTSVFHYPLTGHSFDGNKEPESTLARTRTINFLKAKLGL